MSKAANVTNFYKTLKGYANISYDILGLSYYPDYHGSMANFENVINTLEKDYPDKKIMVVETGYSYAWHIGNTYNLESTYPLTEEGQRKFTADLITMLNKHSSVNGLYWWWPEDNGNKSVTTNWWNAALYNHNTGQPWAAFYELKNFLSEDASVNGISADEGSNAYIYDLSGRRITEMKKPGVYIKGKRKIMK
jgi:arabinogalactan endo-1,4-beta-galactosidase